MYSYKVGTQSSVLINQVSLFQGFLKKKGSTVYSSNMLGTGLKIVRQLQFL